MTDTNAPQHPTPESTETHSLVEFTNHLANVHHSIAKSYAAFAEVAPIIIKNAQRNEQMTHKFVETISKALDQLKEQSPLLDVAAKLAPLKELYDVETTQLITGLGRQSLYNMANLGRIDSTHIAGRLKFSSEAITAYLLEHQTPMQKSLSAIAQLARQAHALGIDLSSVVRPCALTMPGVAIDEPKAAVNE